MKVSLKQKSKTLEYPALMETNTEAGVVVLLFLVRTEGCICTTQNTTLQDTSLKEAGIERRIRIGNRLQEF